MSRKISFRAKNESKSLKEYIDEEEDEGEKVKC